MKLLYYFNFIVFIFIYSWVFAQSDYRITQEFKSRQRSFEIAIEYAKTIDELRKIEKEINEFRNEFKGNKELLNRALYPGNFETSFKVLADKVEFTNKKLTDIQSLETKVTELETSYVSLSGELKELSSQINSLKNTNSRLMTELRAFKSGYGGSKESIDSLENLVEELKDGIAKRDTLIKEIMDNIFMNAEHSIQSLNEAEIATLKTKIQGTSLIDNIRNLIYDNIEFLNASLFTKEDLSMLSSELNEFEERWNNFGPKLFDIYSSDKGNKDKLEEIDSLISVWNSSIDESAWRAINSIFENNNIVLSPFNNDSTFLASVISYIDNEIKNISETSKVENEQKFVYFSDRSWNEKIKPIWVPFLLSKDLITEQSITAVELKIDQWEDNLSGSKSYFIYAIIILLALIIISSIFVIMRKSRKSTADSNIYEESDHDFESRRTDDDINDGDKFIDDEKK